jgi:Domain of unknown function (DUF5659)
MLEDFHTSDYGQTAFLTARGFPIESSEANGNHVVFHFRSTPELLNAISDYSSNAPIPCRDFFHALRRTKTLIRRNTQNDRSERQPRS